MTSSPPPVHRHQINITAVADGSSTTTTSTTTPWSCETNWTVTRGSLESAVTFESFDFPIDSESTGPKPPLLLVPPSSTDCEPCEIKLNFTQKHEIRQVYVRSTARNYEIYYATNLQSENEYLCTVRCSATSVEENSFPETDAKNAIFLNLEDPNETSPNRKVAGENNNIGTNEDDWVEIKLPVGQVDQGNTYSPNRTSRNYQNYYEATAEINDSEPCTSLTLRLVSLQSKAFVHVDEIYVFADCISTDDSQKQTVNPETSSGSSLMTMLVPTLLGLSKSRSLQLPDQHTSKSVEKPSETESRPATESTRSQFPGLSVSDPSSGKGLSDDRPESVGRVGNSESGATAELTQCHVPSSTSEKEVPLLPRTFHDPNTALLEQLVSRVSRIEDVMLRFEENMLKPLNNIETRLHYVEQQVELLAKNSHFPILPSHPTSQPKPENINQPYDDSESESQHDIVVESQHSDDEKQEPQKTEKQKKKYVSIDDALASALAGFSSVTKLDDEFPDLPLEVPEEECLKSNNDTLFSSESLKPIEKEDDDIVTVDVLNSSEDVTATYSDVSTTEISKENSKTDDENFQQDKILTFDKNDILKYFPDQGPEVKKGSEYEYEYESGVDFETSVLEVKFACLENGDLKSHVEALLSYTDDTPVTVDEGISIEETEGSRNGNGLLVELDGDDVAEVVMQDNPDGHVETFFDSLI